MAWRFHSHFVANAAWILVHCPFQNLPEFKGILILFWHTLPFVYNLCLTLIINLGSSFCLRSGPFLFHSSTIFCFQPCLPLHQSDGLFHEFCSLFLDSGNFYLCLKGHDSLICYFFPGQSLQVLIGWGTICVRSRKIISGQSAELETRRSWVRVSLSARYSEFWYSEFR